MADRFLVAMKLRLRTLGRWIIDYRIERDDWRHYGDSRTYRLDVLSISLRFTRQTTPDHRWHFYVSQRSSDGLGVTRRGGWASQGGSPHYYTSMHVNWWLSLSMRPVYTAQYAAGFVRDWARLTRRHPIKVSEELVKSGRTIVPDNEPEDS